MLLGTITLPAIQLVHVQALTSGSYTATADGFAGPIEVTAQINDQGEFESIDVSHSETPEIGGAALGDLREVILNQQSTDIEIVSGASLSSKGFQEALNDIVVQAGGQVLETVASSAVIDEENGFVTIENVAAGYVHDVRIKSTFYEGEIIDVEVLEQNETPEVFDRAWPRLKSSIIDQKTFQVDAISGATITSNAILGLVEEAYALAEIEVTETETEEVKLEDTHTEILVIGGGPSGLAAAISAKENGADEVLVIEKLGILSGNGKFDLNFYDVFNSEAQKANDIEDSKEQFIADKSEAGETPERLEAWASEAEGIDAWLRSFGVELNYNYGTRNHMATEDLYAGQEIQRGMEEYIEELGVEVRLDTEGGAFITDGDKVIGVEVSTPEGNYNITADYIIVATGGFSNSAELLEKYAPGHENLATSNQKGTTGDYVEYFEEIGADFNNMDKVRIYPTIALPWRDLTNSKEGSLFVNLNGERFVNERSEGMEMAQAILEQPDEKVWMIFDSQKALDHANIRKQMAQGKFIEADSYESLAKEIGVDEESLINTINQYNENAINQVEDEFSLTPERALNEEGPYYAVRVESAVHMTKGGVLTNEQGQVLNQEGEVFANLFATGEVTWQSGGYSQSVAWGKIAGRNVAELMNGEE